MFFAPLLKLVDAAEVTAWERVKASKEGEDFEAFLRAHPEGHFAERAKRLIAALRPAPVALAPSPTSVRNGGKDADHCAEKRAGRGPAAARPLAALAA